MKKGKVFMLSFCVLTLLLFTIMTFIPSSWAGKPPPQRTSTSKSGYAMFRDANGDAIKSDNGKQYIDCYKKGEDLVLINVWNDDGSVRWVDFYPGRMKHNYPNYPPSNRRIKFCFNVSNLTQPSDSAVQDILLQLKDGAYRSSTPGFIDNNTIHSPIIVHFYNDPQFNGYFQTDQIQFAVDPGYLGTDPKAITQAKVDDYYGDDTNVDYWDTIDEYTNYIIYTIDFGYGGFEVQPIQYNKGKPVTWIIRPATDPNDSTKPLNPIRLFIRKTNSDGEIIILLTYPSVLPFEFAVSLNPISAYPTVNKAPSRINNASTTWGEIKGR